MTDALAAHRALDNLHASLDEVKEVLGLVLAGPAHTPELVARRDALAASCRIMIAETEAAITAAAKFVQQ